MIRSEINLFFTQLQEETFKKYLIQQTDGLFNNPVLVWEKVPHDLC